MTAPEETHWDFCPKSPKIPSLLSEAQQHHHGNLRRQQCAAPIKKLQETLIIRIAAFIPNNSLKSLNVKNWCTFFKTVVHESSLLLSLFLVRAVVLTQHLTFTGVTAGKTIPVFPVEIWERSAGLSHTCRPIRPGELRKRCKTCRDPNGQVDQMKCRCGSVPFSTKGAGTCSPLPPAPTRLAAPPGL